MIQDFFANGMLISVMSAIDLLSVKDDMGPVDLSRRGEVRSHERSVGSRASDTPRQRGIVMTPIFFFTSQDSDYSQLTIPVHQEFPDGERKGKEHRNDHHTDPADRHRAIDSSTPQRASIVTAARGPSSSPASRSSWRRSTTSS